MLCLLQNNGFGEGPNKAKRGFELKGWACLKGSLELDTGYCRFRSGLCHNRDRNFSTFLKNSTVHCVKHRQLQLI